MTTFAMAPIFPGAWNRWQLAMAESAPADAAQRASEFFRAHVFPPAGVTDEALAHLAITPTLRGARLVTNMPTDAVAIDGPMQLVDVEFWAPKGASQIMWPSEPGQVVLYRVHEPDKGRGAPVALTGAPIPAKGVAHGLMTAGLALGAGVLGWAAWKRLSGRKAAL